MHFLPSPRGRQCLLCGVGRMRFRPFLSELHPKGGSHRAPPRRWEPNAPLWSAPSHRQDFLAGGLRLGFGRRQLHFRTDDNYTSARRRDV